MFAGLFQNIFLTWQHLRRCLRIDEFYFCVQGEEGLGGRHRDTEGKRGGQDSGGISRRRRRLSLGGHLSFRAKRKQKERAISRGERMKKNQSRRHRLLSSQELAGKLQPKATLNAHCTIHNAVMHGIFSSPHFLSPTHTREILLLFSPPPSSSICYARPISPTDKAKLPLVWYSIPHAQGRPTDGGVIREE